MPDLVLTEVDNQSATLYNQEPSIKLSLDAYQYLIIKKISTPDKIIRLLNKEQDLYQKKIRPLAKIFIFVLKKN